MVENKSNEFHTTTRLSIYPPFLLPSFFFLSFLVFIPDTHSSHSPNHPRYPTHDHLMMGTLAQVVVLDC
jgi:hypothetical protein